MLSANALCGWTRWGRELSSSLDEPPKVKTGFFFFNCAGCPLRSTESELNESSPDDAPRWNMPGLFMSGGLAVWAAAMSASGIEEGALRRGTDRYEELM